jgi:hypothetical protein
VLPDRQHGGGSFKPRNIQWSVSWEAHFILKVLFFKSVLPKVHRCLIFHRDQASDIFFLLAVK